MKLDQVKVEDAIAIRIDRRYYDLHNNFTFWMLTYDTEHRTIDLLWLTARD